MRAREVAQLVKDLLYKQEALSSIPQNPHSYARHSGMGLFHQDKLSITHTAPDLLTSLKNHLTLIHLL